MGTVRAILGQFGQRTTAAISAPFSTFRRTMVGYDPSFLGKSYTVPLPSFSAEFSPNVLTRADRPDTYFQDGSYTTYIHYSVATNKSLRQPIVVALNIDQDKIKSVRRGSWNVDPQVGFDYQLDNRYYRSNPYDRGHLARRSSAAWGDTEADARDASDATMFYTNASLQHANFNQDEWLGLEDWVKNLTEDSTNKISVFSGPIYNRQDGTSRTIGSPPAIIPSAFFKVVCFVDKSRNLTTRAFFMAQDRRALSDKSAKRRNFDLGVYQVSVRMIEEETGLVFPAVLKETNPMIFTPPTPEGPLPSRPGPVRDPIFPEIVPVAPGTRVDEENARKPGVVQNSNVLILSAMVNAVGNERKNEWVTIGNFGSEEVDLAGWTLSDSKRAPLELSQKLEPGETVRFKPLMMNRNTGVVLYNKGGSITLTDPDGYVHDRVVYSVASDNIRENVPVIFHLDK